MHIQLSVSNLVSIILNELFPDIVSDFGFFSFTMKVTQSSSQLILSVTLIQVPIWMVKEATNWSRDIKGGDKVFHWS